MLVSSIIAKGMSLADVSNMAFYTPNDQIQDINVSWKDLYAFLCDNNDDYFLTKSYVLSSSFSLDPNRQFTYLFALPVDFYRLRLLQFQGSGAGNQYLSVSKMTIENFGNGGNLPGYRMVGTNLEIYDPVGYSKYCIWYYPAPVILTTVTDIVYPNNMIPELMAYQIAIEIRRKQKMPTAPWETRRNEIMQTMNMQSSRDDSHAEPTKDIFASGFNPWI